MEASPRSPYRKGHWTVTKLKEELQQRSLTISGKKEELIERLEHDDSSKGPSSRTRPFAGSPSKGPGAQRQSLSGEEANLLSRLTVSQLQAELRSRGMSPLGKKDDLVARLSEAEELTPKVVRSRSPARLSSIGSKRTRSTGVELLHSAGRVGWTVTESAKRACDACSPAMLISVSALLVFVVTVLALNGPHQQHLNPVKVLTAWYSKWFVLGVLSTVGLGVGTFLLYLGPFVARCATAASSCRSVDFPVFGPKAFTCSSSGGSVEHGVLAVLNKVKWEVLLWGLGTVVGYLPSFLLTRLAGRRKAVPLLARLLPFGTWLGPLGFFALAAVPNPLFDLLVLATGYGRTMSKVKFGVLTLLGRAVIKATMGAVYVIFLFSKGRLDGLFAFFNARLPRGLSLLLQGLILAQRRVLQKPSLSPITELVALAWKGSIWALVVYAAVKVVHQVAVEHRHKRSNQ